MDAVLDKDFVAKLASAVRSRAALPAFPAGISLEQAYGLLPEVVSQVCDSGSRGLKAGLTNPDLQQLFGLDEALIGMLYDWGELQPGACLPFREHARIECELGVLLGADGAPIALAPAIEFVYLDFATPEDFTPANLVLSSLGADSYLFGEQIPWDEIDLEAIGNTVIRLERDGELLQEAAADESLNGPANAVAWCLEQSQKRSLEVGEGGLILTGTCGNALPAPPGKYTADYGVLGSLSFTIEEVAQ